MNAWRRLLQVLGLADGRGNDMQHRASETERRSDIVILRAERAIAALEAEIKLLRP